MAENAESRDKGFLTHVIRVRGHTVDPDHLTAGDTASPYRVRLRITIVSPSTKAGTVVYDSAPSWPTMNIATDDFPIRVDEGVFTFYGIPSPKHIADATKWRVEDGGTLRKGYVYDIEWNYDVDGITYTEIIRKVFDAPQPYTTTPKHIYTFKQLRDSLVNFLGGEPGSATSSEIVNDALTLLWNDHTWSFHRSDPVLLDTVAGQPYIDLPHDFLNLVSIDKTNDPTHTMIQASPSELSRLRERGIAVASPLVTFFYITNNPARDMKSVPVSRLELYPTPTDTRAGVYRIVYDRMVPGLVEDDDIPPLPVGLFPVLKQAVRVVGAIAENLEQEVVDREMNLYRQMLGNAIRIDNGRLATNHLGPIGKRGGMSRYNAGDVERWLTRDSFTASIP